MVVEGEGMGLKTSVLVGDCGSKGDGTCDSGSQMTEIYDSAPKVRKPYTITKQREKWTEEEHLKFLEALKLYGRGWRQIEEHVGTKTAVQIRSHAQKFFSKVVRGSTGSVESSMKPMEIPPPRPKRKPMHPYPRKSAESLNGTSVSNQPERSPSPNFSAADQGTNSPTSVLSCHGSDALGSAGSVQCNTAPSSTSCTTEMRSTSLSPSEKENDYMIFNSSDEKKRSFPGKQLTSSTLENLLSMKFELGAKDTACTKEGEETKALASTSFKLFGRTVLLSDFRKESAPGAEDSQPLKTDQGIVLTASSEQLDTNLSLGGVLGNLNQLASGSAINHLKQQKESFNNETANSPMLWWTLYQVPFHFLAPCNQTMDQTTRNSCSESTEDDKEIQKEGSCTDSNEGSATAVEILRDKSLGVVDSFSQEPCAKGSVEPSNSRKGFVPYKRCLAERDNTSSVIVRNDRERQKIRVC